MPQSFDFASPPFDRLRPAERTRVEAAVDVEFFREGALVLRAGALPDFYHVIIKGLVEERAGSEPVALHGSGDGFDSGILLHQACRHDFLVREEAICWLLPIEDLLELTANNAAFGLWFFQSLSQKLDSLGERQGAPASLGAMTIRVRDAAPRQPLHLPAGASLAAAAAAMDEGGRRAVLVEEAGRLGIVTDVDLTRAVLRRGLPPETSLGQIAQAAPVSVESDDFLAEAAWLMARRGIRHLLVREDGVVTGLLDAGELLASLATRSDALHGRIDSAASVAELAEAADGITQLVRQLHGTGTRPRILAALSSELHRRLVARLFALLAPAGLAEGAALLVMGSEGRGEFLLRTDQDNGLILADETGRAGLDAFCGRFAEAMVAVGFPPCPGGVMLSNPLWVRPLADWRREFRRWAAAPDEAALMSTAIFCDASLAAGRDDLLEAARDELFAALDGNAAFHARFARAIDLFQQPGGLMALLPGSRAGQEQGLDVKRAGLFPLMHGIRALALEQKIRETGTARRIRRLQEAGLLDRDGAAELIDAFWYLAGLRLALRLEKMRLHRPPDDLARPDLMGKLERDLLKDSLDAVKRLRELVRHHFRLAWLG
ncbi:DUF294 nucleotidyltransferase-like domain-containing protein [Geminicoccaceae bacterium 1502E]|nr:DUF294 nucleotidyltransferase-like domain-containing protein [Geminicoccaceae bacterium 1502E]